MPNLTLDLPKTPTINPNPVQQVPNPQVPDIATGMAQARAQMPKELQGFNQTITKDLYSPLSRAMRYTDPGIGYNPLDFNLEDKYATAHPWQGLGNALVKTGVGALTAAAETVAFIPLAIYGAFNRDLKDIYNNPFINQLNDWNKQLEEALPNYVTNYEQEHPVGKFFFRGGVAPFLNGVGNVARGAGTMAGFIAGAAIQDAIIGAVTGGAGLSAAFAENGAQASRLWGRLSRLFAAEPEILAARGEAGLQRALPQAIDNALPYTTGANVAADALQTGVNAAVARTGVQQGIERSVGGNILGAEAPDVFGTLQTPLIDRIKNRVLQAKDVTKIKNGIRFEIAHLSNAMGMGTIEANAVYNDSKQQMIDDYYQQYNQMPDLATLNKIEQIATKSANITMGANVALQYFTSRINWGSLFKPASQVTLGSGIIGFGKNIARQSVVLDATERAAGNLVYKVEKNIPEDVIGKILLHGERLGTQASHGIVMGAQFGLQSGLRKGAMDYAMRSYNARNTNEAVQGINSFLNGVSEEFTSTQGWDAILSGVLGGMLLGAGTRGITRRRGAETLTEQLQNQANALNANSLKSVIDANNKVDSYVEALRNGTPLNAEGLEGQIGHVARQKSLADDYAKAVSADDVKAAHDLRDDLAFNHWHYANKNSMLQARKEEFAAARAFEGQAFKDYWGLDDTPENRTQIDTFINEQLALADVIAKNGDAVQRVSKNPYNRRSQPLLFSAFEARNDALARSLTKIDVGEARIADTIKNIKAITPTLDIQQAADLTSIAGLRNTLTRMRTASNQLATQIEAARTVDPALHQKLVNKKQALDNLFTRTQRMVLNSTTTENGYLRNTAFNGAEYLDVLRDLYNLHSGNMLENGYLLEQAGDPTQQPTPINYDQLAANLQRLQDVRQLAKDKLDFQRLYNHFRTDAGAKEWVSTFMERLNQDAAQNLNEDGTLRNSEAEADQIRAEEQGKVTQTDSLLSAEEQTPGTADKVKQAAQKRANGEALTPEEQDLANTFNEDFTAYTEAELNVNQRTMATPWNQEQPTTIPGDAPRIQRNKQFSNTTPEHLAFSLFKNKQFILDSEVNTHDLIFNTHSTKDIGEFTGRLTPRPERNESADFTDDLQPIPGGKLYRAPFTEAIQVSVAGKEVGELRPSDSIYYMDADNNPQPIFNADGTLAINAEQYADLTNNAIGSYNSFKRDMEQYHANYQALLAEARANNNNVTDAMLSKYFVVGINGGAARQNKATEVVNDTPLNKLAIKNTAIAHVARDADGTLYLNVAKNFGLTPEELAQVKAYNNTQLLLGLEGRYVAVFPQLGQVRDNSFVVARNVQRNQPIDPNNITKENTKVTAPPNVFENYTIDFRPKQVATQQPVGPEVAQPAPVSYVKTKAELAPLVKDIFGLTDAQAKASADLFDAQANAWAQRTGRPASEYYSEIGFGTELPTQEVGVLFDQAELQQQKLQVKEATQRNGKYLKAPNGKNTNLTEDQWLTTQTPMFKAWWGDSKATDVNGDPMVFYHGTGNAFEVFDPKLANEQSNYQRGQIFVSPDYEFAEGYSETDPSNTGKKPAADNPAVMPLFVKANKIFDYENAEDMAALKASGPMHAHQELVDSQDLSYNWDAIEDQRFQAWLRANNYDGFYVKEQGVKNLGVYKPTQIKDASGQNRGIDATNPNLYEQNPRFYSAVKQVADYLKLEYKQLGANFGGFVKQGSGSTGKALADRVGEVIKDRNLSDQLIARYDLTHKAIVFEPRHPENLLFQNAKGAYDTVNQVIYGLTNPDVTTFPHELAHAWEANLTAEERKTVLDWSSHESWTRETSENFAKGFEQYLTEGNQTKDAKLNTIFQKFAKWLADVAQQIKATLGLQLNDTMRSVYARMLNSEHIPAEVKAKVETSVEAPTEAGAVERPVFEVPTNKAEIEQQLNDVQQRLDSNEPLDIQQQYDLASQERQLIDALNNFTEPTGDYTIHQIGDAYVVQHPDGDVSTDFETREQAQDYINAQRPAPEQPAAEPAPQPVDNIVVEQPAQVTEPAAITEQDVKIGRPNTDGVYTATRGEDIIGRMVEDLETGEWNNPDVDPNESNYYLGDTRTEAVQTLIDDYNDANNLTTQPAAEAPQTYHTIKQNGKEVTVRLTKADVINEFVDVHGNTYKDATLGQPATLDQFNAQPAQEKPTPKYQAGDAVTTQSGDTYNITNTQIRNTDKGFEVYYQVDGGNYIAEAGITRRAVKEATSTFTELTAQQKEYNNVIQNVGKRFQQVFGNAIKMETNVYDFDAPAKFENGKVLINLGYIEQHPEVNLAEAVSHEYMHPFTTAVKLSNRSLYNSLIEELNTNHKDIIQHVEKLYADQDAASRADEALTTYLGRELSKAFTKDGHINVDYVKQRPLLERFVNWLRQIVDQLTGKTKAKTLDEFVKAANNNEAIGKQNLESRLERLKLNNEAFTKLLPNKTLDGKIGYLLNPKNAEKLTEAIGQQEFTELTQAATNFRNGLSNVPQDYIFEVKPTIKNTVEFNKNADGTINVVIDPTLANNSSSLVDVISQFAQNSPALTAAEKESLTDVAYSNMYSNRRTKDMPLRASDLNPLLKLQDTSNFVLYQLAASDLDKALFNLQGKELKGTITAEEQLQLDQLTSARDSYQRSGGIAFDYTTDELNAINQLTAFMKTDKDWAERARARVVKSLNTLKQIADVRLKSEGLKSEYEHLTILDKSTQDSVAFMQEYAQVGSDSLKMAYRKWREITNDLKTTQTPAQLREASKAYNEITNLLGLYKEFTTMVDANNFDFKDADDLDLYLSLQKGLSAYNAIHNSVQDTAIALTTKWFEPRMQLFNENMAKNGYTEESYKLTPEVLYDYFKHGTQTDSNPITYWLGANITSKDPINALFANTLNDAISANHVQVVDSAQDVNVAFKDFINLKGLSNSKQQQDYYIKNYLRKADVKTTEYDKATGEYKDVYVKKYALHQQYLWDQFHKDLEAVQQRYSTYKNAEELAANRRAIMAWKKQQGYTVDADGNETITAAKYLNKDYAKLQQDGFFKLLERKYNESNLLYGDDQLQFGVIPQKYTDSFMQNTVRSIKDIKGSATQQEAYNKVVDKLQRSVQADGVVGGELNLDGTIYRTLKTNLTKIKTDEFIDLNLPELIVDFIEEGNHHGVLKQTQHNANILMSLLEGNAFLGVKPREFALVDKSRAGFNIKARKEAKAKLKQLDADIAAGKKVDQAEYDKVKGQANQPVYNKVFDKLLGRTIPGNTRRNNEMLINQIKNMYYHVPDEDLLILNRISGKQLSNKLSYYTSVLSLSGNTLAAIGNVSIGNTQLWIEANGGQYFTKRDLAKATAEYTKNSFDAIKDLSQPIKSKQTQLLIQLDAIQGEIRDNFGRRITGNLASKLFNWGNLFLLTKLGEHQIQTTNMLAMLMGKKVQTNAGETISLYDAYVPDKDGRYKLRKDIKFTQQDLTQFISNLHGVNRALNGNYSETNKSMLQYKWYGNAILKFRKYIYDSFRTRWAGERVDYERNTPEVGYLNYLFTDYIPKGLKGLVKGNFDGLKTKQLKPYQQYALRKAFAEMGVYAGITLLTTALFAGGEKRELTTVEKALVLQLLRTRQDIGMFSLSAGGEGIRQLENPTATLRAVNYMTQFFEQLAHPNEQYATSSNTHNAGDSKLWYKGSRLIPFHKAWDGIINGKFADQVEANLSFQPIVNSKIEGVTPRNSNF